MIIKVGLQRKILSLFLLFACFLSLAAFSQTPDFKKFNLGKGKRTLKVQAQAQNASNQIYFGTDNGLFLYNGITFEQQLIGDSLAIKNVTALCATNDGTYCGGSKGELRLLANKKLVSIDYGVNEEQSKIAALHHYNDSILIVATYGSGVYMVKSKGIQHISTQNGLSDDYCYSIAVSHNRAWIGTDAGINSINLETGEVEQITMKNGLPDNIVVSLNFLNDSTLLIGTYDMGIWQLNINSLKFSNLFTSAAMTWTYGPIKSICTNNKNCIWAGTKENGLVLIKLGEKRNEFHIYSELNGLNSNRILNLLNDAEGNVWIGNEKGVSLYNGSLFEYLTQSDGLPGKNVIDFLEDKAGNFWVSSEAGVHRLSYATSAHGLVQPILDNSNTIGGQIVSLHEDALGNIWMGSYGDGVYFYNTATQKLKHLTDNKLLQSVSVMDIVHDQNNTIWIATLGLGVLQLKYTEKGYDVRQMHDPAHLRSEYIYTLFVDATNTLWVGTDGAGIIAFDADFQFKTSIEGAIASENVYSIAQDNTGNIWFATSDQGIYRFANGELKAFTDKDGVRSNNCVVVAAGNHGEIVAVHALGIDVLYPKTSKFLEYNSAKEAFEFEPNLNSFSITENGIWIGTESGAVLFNLEAANNLEQVPKVTIAGLRVSYNNYELESEAVFDYNQNHFIFDFLGIWMKNPTGIRYKYQLEGFDKGWSFETESRVATYSSLPPGNYTFRVVASAGNGYWTEENAAVYRFTVLKPFWLEWWFILILILFGLVVIVYYTQWRTKKLQEDKKLLEDEVSRRTEEILHQKELVEEKNREITDSITYAKRIQQAILPPDKLFSEHMGESFVMYKPKDIVAGDFYWLEIVNDLVIFAAADCTGHGVPGAMVSVVCHNALNRAVREFKLTNPAEILDKTLELVVSQFNKSNEEVRDGMDIALCVIDKKNNKAHFAGANNSLYIISDGVLNEVLADKQPIGKFVDPKPFTCKEVDVKKGDNLIVFTDGFADQFGGTKGKKFKYKPFKELLIEIQHLSANQQHDTLLKAFEDWKGNLEQVDDVCIIGIKVE